MPATNSKCISWYPGGPVESECFPTYKIALKLLNNSQSAQMLLKVLKPLLSTRAKVFELTERETNGSYSKFAKIIF